MRQELAHPDRASLPHMPARPKFTGRAPKLTPEIRELFVNTLKLTGSITASAGKCAISKNTAYQWMAKGKEQRPGQPYRDFRDAVALGTRRVAHANQGRAGGRGLPIPRPIPRRHPDSRRPGRAAAAGWAAGGGDDRDAVARDADGVKTRRLSAKYELST